MRFAITAVDRCLGVFEAFLAAGWEPVKLFTIPPGGFVSRNRAVIARAVGLNLPVQISRIGEDDLRDLGARGCDALVCASYDWRIGDWRPHLRYAVNFHPSPLPEGRGAYPAFQALLEGHKAWGVACHKLEPAFDTGEILDAEPFALTDADCHESLDLKTQMAMASLARRVARDLPALWGGARPQAGGSYWKRLGDGDRTLDFAAPVETILRTVRAFGLTESIAKVNGQTIYVRRAVGWTEPHAHKPGTVVHADGRRSVVAAADGYIGLIEWSPVPIVTTELVGRPIGEAME